MPGVSRGHRAEAKYNVTLDFPNLGLHSAAASGDIGLVKYALQHGQPINSALDGVLPLHAACSGGSDLVVRLLIEKGADVNAPRLPRRYSTDKNRDASNPIVGASGSTPLHFACANGHAGVVVTLLLHGAHPDRPDKHGVTPEMIARQNGWDTCADVLKQWSHNKDKDLRDRELPRRSQVFTDAFDDAPHSKGKEHHILCNSVDCQDCSLRKRIRLKRSIDNAIHMLKPSLAHQSSTTFPPPSTLILPIPGDQQSSSSIKPLGEYTFYPTPDSSTVEELPPLRPSLPQVPEIPRNSSTSHRRPSNLSGSSTRRPRSAGTDADETNIPPKVKGKISLLNIFKKSNNDLYGTPESMSGYSSSTSAITSGTPSPAPDCRSVLSAAASPYSRSSDLVASTPPDSSSLNGYGSSKYRQRLLSESAGPSPIPPQAVELHHALSRDSLREYFNAQIVPDDTQPARSPSARPGILRAHARSASSSRPPPESGRSGSMSGVQSPGQSVRALRFDSSSTASSSPSRKPEAHSSRHTSRSPSRVLHGSGSVHSLRSHSSGSPWGLQRDGKVLPVTTSPSMVGIRKSQPVHEPAASKEEDEEEEYGNPVEPHVGLDQVVSEERTRRPSVMSSRSSSSMIPSQDALVTRTFNCPFSINNPPPEDIKPSPKSANLLGIQGIDNRARGDSVSSESTNTSTVPTSSSSASISIPTPSLSYPSLPIICSPSSIPPDLPSPVDILKEIDNDDMTQKPSPTEDDTTISVKRSRAPLDIDIRSISSHAQAEALVQRAQQRIFDLQNSPVEDEFKTMGVSVGEGRTPLSARLAAYGESLAIERKFKQEEERRKSPHSSPIAGFGSDESADSRVTPASTVKNSASTNGLDRKFSLDERVRSTGMSGRIRKMRRPHTAGGTPTTESTNTFLTVPSHQHSLSSGATLSFAGDTSKTSRTLVSSITPPISSYLKPRVETLPLPSERPKLPRSRTPDPEVEPSRSYMTAGIPLSRFPTAPGDSLCDVLPERGLSKQEREVARANKLAKMGFSSTGDSWQNSNVPARTPKHRFGGIRTLVQTLTGK